MKLLVMSDSHGNVARMRLAAGQVKPDAILHLGDKIADAAKLQQSLPGTEFHSVKGNCDFSDFGEIELFLTLGGVKIYMAHGHTLGAKSGVGALAARARGLGADLALYGHTHLAMIRHDLGLALMNPGQMLQHDKRLAASFGIVTIEAGKFNCTIEELPF